MKKQPTFFEGVGVALIASIVGSAGFFILSTVFSDVGVFRVLIGGLSFVYIVYLLSRSQERIGRITVISAWFVLSALNWIFVPSLLLYIVIHLGMMWLTRSLYFYQSLFSSLTDLGLISVSLAVSFWTWSHSHSLFLSLWSFFLLQALFVLIPRQIQKFHPTTVAPPETEQPFDRAHRAAEIALRKMMTTH